MPGTEFTATSRVPTRPLSYANKEMAYRKELLVDYTNGMIYVIDENGNEHSITQQVYEMLIANGDLAGDIQIELPGGVVVTIQEALTSILTDLYNIKNNIDEIKKIIDELLSEDGKIAIDVMNHMNGYTPTALSDVRDDQTFTVTFIGRDGEYYQVDMDFNGTWLTEPEPAS